MHALAIIDDPETLRVVGRALEASGNHLDLASDLAAGLTRAAAEAPDLVIVDVSLGQNAGLALVHHLRAVAPNTALFALAPRGNLDLGRQALALGASAILAKPPSGDEILTAIAQVRTRQAESHRHSQLVREAELLRRARHLAVDMAQLAAAQTRRDAAELLVRLLGNAGTSTALVYQPTTENSRQLVRVAAQGAPAEAPTYGEELQILGLAGASGWEVVRLTADRRTIALLLVGGAPGPDLSLLADTLLILAPQLAASLALVAAREQSVRGTMKDANSGAYTLAYFIDVTGREIDKARRHDRRFALATLGVHPTDVTHSAPPRDTLTEVAERVLACVRDTDVLARVDDNEFHLLMPETGGLGAHACRRRILHQLTRNNGLRFLETGGFELHIGTCTYPQDGATLSQLLRVARHRADASRYSPVFRFDLDRLPLPEVLETLLANAERANPELGLHRPRIIRLPMMDAVRLAATAVTEAIRGGETRVVAAQHAGMSIGPAVRAALQGIQEKLTLQVVDLEPHPTCNGIELLVLVAEHGTYALLGRTEVGLLTAVHSSDPVLSDLLLRRLGETVKMRLLD